MKNISLYDDSTAYSFEQLIDKFRANFSAAKEITEKENIIYNYIIDSQLSENFLKELISDYSKKTNDINTIQETVLSYFNNLVYSLNCQQIKNIINIMKKNYKICIESEKYNYLMTHDPITTFQEIPKIYNSIRIIDSLETKIQNIDEYLKKMSQVIYDIELDNYYFPPLPQQPIYSYNYYLFKIFNILNKFKKKRIKQIFEENYNKNEEKFENYNDINDKCVIYEELDLFFSDTACLFKKLNLNNIDRDIKILKIITFHLNLIEHSRDYLIRRNNFLQTIQCLNSNPINNKICDICKLYRKNSENLIPKDEWEKIGFNEEITIKIREQINTKIKHFNENILEYNTILLKEALKYPKIENLNIDGLLNHSFIKYNNEIENYTKELLKYILASNKYINIFIRNDNSFDLNNDETDKSNINKNSKKILESMFRGPNKDKIFEELWSNTFCVPFYENLSGFNNRTQYSIFLNTQSNFRYDSSPKEIICKMHSEINTIIHEISHNLVLLLAANIGSCNYETKIISQDQRLKELQNTYKNIYHQDYHIYDEFSDFGDLVEVELYGIKPSKFKTFSALFCLDKNSYDLKDEEFRKICANLYKYDGLLDNAQKVEEIIKAKEESDIIKIFNNNNIKDIEKILIRLLKSEFITLACSSFNLKGKLANDFYDSEKARSHNYSLLYNVEYSINRNYCDKLDNL